MDEIRLAKTLYLAEHLGGVFYDQFCDHVDNGDVKGTFSGFAGDEHNHAAWYAEWLDAKGETPPGAAALRTLAVPSLHLALAPTSLERKLKIFAVTEATAARHLHELASKVRDPELKAIVLRTIPYEEKHARWYRETGRRMLRPEDAK
jgi:rubrerythrin